MRSYDAAGCEDFGFGCDFQPRAGRLQGRREIAQPEAAPPLADNWAYKLEAYDLPSRITRRSWPNGACGLDQFRLGRASARLYQEAARPCLGGASEEEALKMITLHPAWQLGNRQRVARSK